MTPGYYDVEGQWVEEEGAKPIPFVPPKPVPLPSNDKSASHEENGDEGDDDAIFAGENKLDKKSGAKTAADRGVKGAKYAAASKSDGSKTPAPNILNGQAVEVTNFGSATCVFSSSYAVSCGLIIGL